jgi:hypothetical protein
VSDLTKVTFNAVPKTVVCLEGITETSGDTRTDVLNRAVQVYAFLAAAMATGDRLLILHANSSVEEVTLR